jgi:hypothetical protein
MNEEQEHEEEFDDEEAEALLETEVDEDLDRELRAIERTRRKGPKNPDPAWRKLERMREERLTAELIMDLEDYDIGVEDGRVASDDRSLDEDESVEFPAMPLQAAAG